MNKNTANTLEMLDCVGVFVADHPLENPIARVTALATIINAAADAVRAQDNNQDTGLSEFSGAAEHRSRVAAELRAQMRAIALIGNGLDRELHPGLAEQLRMPRNSYALLQSRARSFLEVVTPIKPAFVERGLPAAFDTALAAKIVEFETATQRRDSARANHVGGTASIAATLKIALADVRELDTILSAKYANDPGLYAAWKSARHVRRGARTSTATTPPPASAAAPTA
jgi:hypothetical protein